MKKEDTKDGVHLNEEGYAIWVDYLKKQLPRLANENQHSQPSWGPASVSA